MRPHLRGFTLIELMIVLAVVAVLTAIAYPSYTSYILKGKRATAQSALMDMASKEMAFVLDRRRYGSPTELGFTPPQEVSNDYAFTVVMDNTASPMTFTATATPSASLAAKGELTLTVNQSGARTPASTRGYWGK